MYESYCSAYERKTVTNNCRYLLQAYFVIIILGFLDSQYVVYSRLLNWDDWVDWFLWSQNDQDIVISEVPNTTLGPAMNQFYISKYIRLQCRRNIRSLRGLWWKPNAQAKFRLYWSMRDYTGCFSRNSVQRRDIQGMKRSGVLIFYQSDWLLMLKERSSIEEFIVLRR